MDLHDDRFDVTFDPAVQSADSLLAAVRGEGFEPELVDASAAPPAVREAARVDVATLGPGLAATFERAQETGRPIVFDFWAPG